MRRNILILRLEGFFLDTDSIIQLIAIVILLVLSAFFSSAETSFITVNRIKVLSLVEEGNKRAALVIKIIDQPAKMLSAVLIGNNIVNISCSALATSFTRRQVLLPVFLRFLFLYLVKLHLRIQPTCMPLIWQWLMLL